MYNTVCLIKRVDSSRQHHRHRSKNFYELCSLRHRWQSTNDRITLSLTHLNVRHQHSIHSNKVANPTLHHFTSKSFNRILVRIVYTISSEKSDDSGEDGRRTEMEYIQRQPIIFSMTENVCKYVYTKCGGCTYGDEHNYCTTHIHYVSVFFIVISLASGAWKMDRSECVSELVRQCCVCTSLLFPRTLG